MPVAKLPPESGARVIAFSALLGMAVSVYNYLKPLSGIDGTGGAMLVIGATLILFVTGLVLRLPRLSGGLRTFLTAGCCVGIIGTGFAAYLLESRALLALMALCLAGWSLHMLAPRPVNA